MILDGVWYSKELTVGYYLLFFIILFSWKLTLFFRTVDNRYGGLTTSYPENVNSYEPYLPCYLIRTGYLQKNNPDM